MPREMEVSFLKSMPPSHTHTQTQTPIVPCWNCLVTELLHIIANYISLPPYFNTLNGIEETIPYLFGRMAVIVIPWIWLVQWIIPWSVAWKSPAPCLAAPSFRRHYDNDINSFPVSGSKHSRSSSASSINVSAAVDMTGEILDLHTIQTLVWYQHWLVHDPLSQPR